MPRSDETFPTRVAGASAERYARLSASPDSLSCGAALDLASLQPGETVVDLGCGRGGDVVRAAARVGPEGAAIGVDANPAMLDAARLHAAGLPNLRLVQSDLAAVALPAGCADVVISNCAINHAPDKTAVYREIFRLLRPHGRFVVSDVVSAAELPEVVRSDPAAWAACYGGGIPEGDYLAAIASAGLRHVTVLRRTAPYERGGVRILSISVEGRR